jgi:hypothetical protein
LLDPREFKAPFITIENIRKAADQFRSQYWPQDTIPIDIFEILEFELGIEIRSVLNLKEAGDHGPLFCCSGRWKAWLHLVQSDQSKSFDRSFTGNVKTFLLNG